MIDFSRTLRSSLRRKKFRNIFAIAVAKKQENTLTMEDKFVLRVELFSDVLYSQNTMKYFSASSTKVVK